MNESQAISRSYHSPARAESAAQTRRRILDTARACFVTSGYTATAITEIAAGAGVSVQTVYNSVGGKAQLLTALQELVDEAGNVPELRQRMAAADDPREVVALAAHLRRLMMERAGDIVGVLSATAVADQDVAQAYAFGQAASYAGCARAIARIASLGGLRGDWDHETATDTLYTLLHHAMWHRLVDERGWTPDAFEAWTSDLLARTLLAPDAPTPPGGGPSSRPRR